MPSITETATIRSDPETLWREIGGFGSVAEWHPLLQSIEVMGDGVGAMRVAHGGDGSEQVERLQMIDAEHHRYRYTLEQSPMPVRNYEFGPGVPCTRGRRAWCASTRDLFKDAAPE